MIKLNQFALGTALSAFLLVSSSQYGCAETSQNLIAQASETAAKETLETIARKTLDTSIKPAILNHPRLVLKNGAHFLVMDESGLMPDGTSYGYGLYKDDTRYLSMLDMSLNGHSPVLLSASTDEGYAGRFLYGNAADSASGAAEQQIMLKRDVVVNDGVFEKLTVTNFGNSAIDVTLEIKFASDYADMFEVRGMGRKARGQLKETILPDETAVTSSVVISYGGLDNKVMSTRLMFDEKAVSVQKDRIVFKFHLNGQQTKVINMAVGTSFDAAFQVSSKVTTFDTEKESADLAYKAWRDTTARVTTSNTEFDRLMERSVRDLYILRQPTPRGNCLAAGIPWFAVAFGRDQEITAMQTLMFFPTLAKDVIEVLAAYQGKQTDSYTEEKSGRIMHELRLGEMARMKEIAFTPYYGTVDGTPLWLVLVSRYFEQTGDIGFIKKHWPEIERALDYLNLESASGYLRYGGKEGAALSNQGWKDSADSVMYANGKLAKAPIALCEPQGYLYTAWFKAAQMAKAIGNEEQAKALSEKAAALKTRFNRDFWMPEKRGIALALDGDGKQCDVYSSNIGHLLASGILNEKAATECADILMSDEMFCGWGIRTLASSETAYNPMSYHNGSVWPHDNAMSIEGLCRIGRSADALRVMSGLFETSKFRPDMRLPELFCGFSDRNFDRPVWYPVSCAPQAWAAGSVFQMLSGCLGLIPDAQSGSLRVVRPALPEWLEHVEVRGIRVGKGICDLQFEREKDGSTHCKVLSSRDVNVGVEN
ncbi:amylo-alpha-1,6-glucosidase [Candidatus Obscuribacterales bacterium]|nr:amylo-alpha-1,6-glucosidase [Candidatus Obscuribacterales bacterium]